MSAGRSAPQSMTPRGRSGFDLDDTLSFSLLGRSPTAVTVPSSQFRLQRSDPGSAVVASTWTEWISAVHRFCDEDSNITESLGEKNDHLTITQDRRSLMDLQWSSLTMGILPSLLSKSITHFKWKSQYFFKAGLYIYMFSCVSGSYLPLMNSLSFRSPQLTSATRLQLQHNPSRQLWL